MKFTKANIVITLLIAASAIAGIGSFASPKHAQAEGQCNILSMGFGQDAGFYGVTPAPSSIPTDLVHSENYITKQINQPARPNDVTRQKVTLKITSENCIGKELIIKIIGKMGELKQNNDNCCRVRGAMTPESNGTVYITYDAGEELCHDKINTSIPSTPWSTDDTIGQAYDCIYGGEVDLGDGTKLTATDSSTNFLYYECVDNSNFLGSPCSDSDKKWALPDGRIVNFTEYNASGNLITGAQTQFNTDSACYYDNTVANGPKYDKSQPDGTKGYLPGCNALLAPLPGLTKVDTTVTLGQYINIIIRVAIGILTALAVVMLIVEGLQYMTTGSITGKYDARKKITNIAIGLLIALGMFVILSTINPNLLNLEPNISDVSISSSFNEDGTVTPGNTGGLNVGECDELDNYLFNGTQKFGDNNNQKRLDALIAKDDAGNSGFTKFTKDTVSFPASGSQGEENTLASMKAFITANSPINKDPLIKLIYDTSKTKKINPFYPLQIWKSESNFATASNSSARRTHNLGNIRAGGWEQQYLTNTGSGVFRDYAKRYGDGDLSWQESIKDSVNLLAGKVYSAGKFDTVEESMPKYCPCGKCAPPENYRPGVGTVSYIKHLVEALKRFP